MARLRRPDLTFDEALASELDRRQTRARDEIIARSRENCVDFATFIKEAWPVIEPETPLIWGWPMDAIADHLMAVARGDIPRLLINVPPGLMKSLMTGVFLGAYLWGPGARPSTRILGTAFKEDHANRDARRMRELVSSQWFQDRWPLTIQGGENDFSNPMTGWRKGRPITSLTGDRGDLVVVDDPHSTAMADSPASREKTARLLAESLPTRLNDPKKSGIIVIMQRLHDGDVSGEILRRGLGYDHLMLPMRFEGKRRCRTSIGFVDPRQAEGELLFPERFDPASLDRIEKEMSPYAIAGQHQQSPTPRTGGLFDPEKFDIVDVIPAGGRWARAWDLAATVSLGTNDPDWTVGLKGCFVDGVIYITEMARFRNSPAERDSHIVLLAKTDGYGCTIRLPRDPAQAGLSQADHFMRMLAGSSVTIKPVTGNKVARAGPASSLAGHGKIKLARGQWNSAFLEEARSFPAGRHDDIVDALSDLVDELTSRPVYDLMTAI
jgi:predicted phage terminase large subunit-like protein